MNVSSKLKDSLYGDQNCIHEYPQKFTLVDLMDREGTLVRAYFCKECQDYKWKEVKDEPWTSQAFLKLKKDQYQVYSNLEGPSVSRKASQK